MGNSVTNYSLEIAIRRGLKYLHSDFLAIPSSCISHIALIVKITWCLYLRYNFWWSMQLHGTLLCALDTTQQNWKNAAYICSMGDFKATNILVDGL